MSVQQVEGALRCARVTVGRRVLCWAHTTEEYTDAGCPVAIAVVAALGLTEETCCEGMIREEQEETGKYSVYTCADTGRSCRTRLVTPWVEP